MATVIRESIHTARKEYRCDASDTWLSSGLSHDDVHSDDVQILLSAEKDGWKILPGKIYRKVVFMDGSEIRTFRALPDMDNLCFKYDLYDEE